MDRFRDKIDENPEEFARAITFHSQRNPFQLVAERYVRKLPSCHPPLIDEWYQTRTFYLSAEQKAGGILFSPDLPERLLRDYRLLLPLYRFLANVREGKE